MADFTIIGYWSDNDQRFATHVRAKDASTAEIKCLDQHEGVVVCGVIRGRHMCLDSETESSFQERVAEGR